MGKVRSIVYIAVTAALMACAAAFTVPLPFSVPVTLQTAVCISAGIILGGRRGAAAMAAYLFSGLIGLPVFSGFSGGIACALKPGFGYIIGFIPGAYLAGALSYKRQGVSFTLFFKLCCPVLLIYLIGLPYQFFVLYFSLGGKLALDFTLSSAAVFLAADIIKAVPVLFLYGRLVYLRQRFVLKNVRPAGAACGAPGAGEGLN